MDRLPKGRFSESLTVSQGAIGLERLGVATLFGLALLSGAVGNADTPLATNDSRGNGKTSAAVSGLDPPPMKRPAIGVSGPLSVAEIRWCMSQEIGLQAIEPRLGTRDAFDRYNELADEFNRRCNARPYGKSDGAEAMQFIDSARGDIVGAALEDIQRLNDGELTRQIQELLEMLEYEPGAIDGVYGTQTKAAIEAFQLKVGWPVDGLLSQELLGRLRVAHMRQVTGREKPPTVSVAIRVMQAAPGAESDTEAVAGAQVIVSGDQGLHQDQQTDERGRIELGRIRAGQLAVDVRRNGERYRSTFQVTEDPLQEFWITLPAPLPAQ